MTICNAKTFTMQSRRDHLPGQACNPARKDVSGRFAVTGLALRRPGQDVTSGSSVSGGGLAAWSGIDDAGRGEGLEGPYYHHFS